MQKTCPVADRKRVPVQLSILHTTRSSGTGARGVLLKRVLVLGALPHGGNELDEPGVLGLLQTAHHAMLHHRHKLLVTQFSVV